MAWQCSHAPSGKAGCPCTRPWRLPAGGRAATEGAALANDISIADLKTSGLTRVLQVLRCLANGAELKYFVVASDVCRAIHHHVRTNPGTIANVHVRSDDGKCTNVHVLPEPGAWIDDGLRVNHLIEFLICAHEIG